MRKLEQKHLAFTKWMKRVIERRNVLKSYKAVTHHKASLLFKTFFVLKRGPQRVKACLKLKSIFTEQAVRPAFNELLKRSE